MISRKYPSTWTTLFSGLFSRPLYQNTICCPSTVCNPHCPAHILTLPSWRSAAVPAAATSELPTGGERAWIPELFIPPPGHEIGGSVKLRPWNSWSKKNNLTGCEKMIIYGSCSASGRDEEVWANSNARPDCLGLNYENLQIQGIVSRPLSVVPPSPGFVGQAATRPPCRVARRDFDAGWSGLVRLVPPGPAWSRVEFFCGNAGGPGRTAPGARWKTPENIAQFSANFHPFPQITALEGPYFRDFRKFPGGAEFNHRWTQMRTDGRRTGTGTEDGGLKNIEHRTPKGRF